MKPCNSVRVDKSTENPVSQSKLSRFFTSETSARKRSLLGTILFFLLLAFGLPALAQQASSGEEAEDDAEVIEIEIEASPIEIEPGTTTYTEEAIGEAPLGEGNLSDLLRLNPNVNFSRSSDLSAGNASLRPDEVSIHGNVFYQNLFLLDGTDTTNDLNPAASEDIWSTPSLVAPHGGSSPQGYYIDVELLEEVQVFDSNIPVEYGGFTGGVVASELKSYKGEDMFSFTYQLQRDDWEKFHVTEDDISVADKYRAVYTPDYEKANYRLSVQYGITEDLGLTLSFNRRTSVFGQEFEDDADIIRLIDYEDSINNLVGKVNTTIGEYDLEVSFRYSNRSHDGLTSTTYTGMFVQEHQGIGTTVDVSTVKEKGSLNLKFSIDQLSDSLESETSFFTYHEYLESSGMSRFEGAFGSSNQEQTRWSVKPKWEFNDFTHDFGTQSITMGGELRGTSSFYERPDDVIFEQFFCVRDNGRLGCRDQDGDGVSSAGDEFLQRRSFWYSGKVDVSYQELSLYVQDVVTLLNTGFLQSAAITLGLRADWESYLDNFNISPRISLSYPTSYGSFSAGTSRYYGRSFFRYELNDEIYGWRESYANLTRPRGRAGEEVPCSVSDFVNCTHLTYDDRTGASDLSTPYSDEYSLGWSRSEGKLVHATVSFVSRNNKDGVSRRRNDDGLYYYTNLGESASQSISTTITNAESISFGQTNTHFTFSLGYRDSTSNRQDDAGYDEQLEEDLVYYEGGLVSFDELPPWDYNIPFTIGFYTTTEIPVWSISWTNYFNHRRGGTVARDSREDYTDASTGLTYDIYQDYDFDSLLTINSKISWTGKLTQRWSMFATLEVNNLFDQIVDQSTVSTRRRFSQGRRFWIELGTRFQ
ncbi:MAG: TonB-dependent receptor plug domain-containing protein [Gammaproteobacteria bacterium]|nr:TonB-dependent receptor plug domain-containing protein [Gammaproteobacteria bacterium]